MTANANTAAAVKVTKWGNSLGIRIPQSMLKQVGITGDNNKVSLKVSDNKIIVEKQRRNLTREALANFDYKKYFAEHDGLDLVDYGRPQGHEMF